MNTVAHHQEEEANEDQNREVDQCDLVVLHLGNA